MNFGRTLFCVTGASIALAAFVTLDYTFSDVFSVPMRESLETGLGSWMNSRFSDRLVQVITLMVYALVGILGGIVGVLAYRIFSRIPPLFAGNKK